MELIPYGYAVAAVDAETRSTGGTAATTRTGPISCTTSRRRYGTCGQRRSEYHLDKGTSESSGIPRGMDRCDGRR